MLTDGLGLLGGTVHLPDLRRAGVRGAARLRLRRHAAGALHARGRRHLHEGRGRGRGPGRQDREGHPRGRPAQRGDHRRQRGRQRGRLRRHGGRHLRELRGDDRRRDDPRHGELRPQGRHLPAARARHRRARLDHQHLHASRPAHDDTSDTALKTVHRGFWIGSVISIVGFFAVAFFYLRFDAAYLATNPDGRGRVPGRRSGGAARVAEPRRGGPRPAPGAHVPHRRVPGRRAQQGDQLLHAHRARAGEVADEGLHDGPRDEHHRGHRARLREHGGGHRGDRRRHPAVGADATRARRRCSSRTAWRWPASAC